MKVCWGAGPSVTVVEFESGQSRLIVRPLCVMVSAEGVEVGAVDADDAVDDCDGEAEGLTTSVVVAVACVVVVAVLFLLRRPTPRPTPSATASTMATANARKR